MMRKSLFVFCDGGARGNPGPAAIGFIVKDNTGKTLVEEGKFIGKATNNVAEYTAVIEALEWLVENKEVWKMEVRGELSSIQFFLDSKLVVNQLNGLFRIKNSNLRNLIIKVRQLEQEIGGNVSYRFISREKNRQADLLVNRTINKKLV